MSFPDALTPARDTGLSAYDAAYLWLARHLGAELVTLDEPLAAAWGRGQPPAAAPPPLGAD